MIFERNVKIWQIGLLSLCLAALAVAQVGTNTNQPAVSARLVGSSYVLDDKHLLEPGDKLSFQILEDRDPARPLLVADSSELDVPYIGRVSVTNRTCKQLAAELKVALEKEYYYRATVVVALDQVNKVQGRVYLTGMVHTQGPLDMYFGEKLTVGVAILRAGGFGEFANKKKVKIVRRPAGGGSSTQTFEVNMVDVLEGGKSEKDMLLEPNDYIVVPSRLLNF